VSRDAQALGSIGDWRTREINLPRLPTARTTCIPPYTQNVPHGTDNCRHVSRHDIHDRPSDECTSPTRVQCATINAVDQQATVDADDEAPSSNSCDDINLNTQRKDPMLADMIDYLMHDTLPDDDKAARKILLTKDYFTIRDHKLLHLGIKRQKNNQTDTPIIEQLCIPKHLQPIMLARYHTQLLHCGNEKLYLSMKQRVFWDNLYTDTDTRTHVANCETCQVAKPNIHPTRGAIQCRQVPPQIFERIHIDHLKLA